MTREEQIRQAIENNLDVGVYKPQYGEMLKGAFYVGAKWADNHPECHWISVKEDLPCNHEDLLENNHCTKNVLAVLEWNEDPSKKHIEICNMCNKLASFDVDFYWGNSRYYTVTHWMRLPEVPKE